MSTASAIRMFRITMAAVMVFVLVALSLPTAQSAFPKAGTKCAKAGLIDTKSSTICTKVGKKLIWVNSKKGKGSNNSIATSGPGSVRPTIESLPVDLALVNFSITLDDKMASLGPIVSVGDSRPELSVQFLPGDAAVRAVSEGVVLEVNDQPDSCDVEINVVNKGAGKNALWAVSYDHVRNVKVRVGSTVTPGQLIGSVGSMFGCGDNGSDLGFVELMVTRSDKQVAVCPLLLMKDDVAAKYRSAIRNVMTRWNEIRPGTYSEAKLKGSGCVANEAKK